jgi:hypothetical protein
MLKQTPERSACTFVACVNGFRNALYVLFRDQQYIVRFGLALDFFIGSFAIIIYPETAHLLRFGVGPSWLFHMLIGSDTYLPSFISSNPVSFQYT